MSGRRKVLDLFEEQKVFLETVVADGIEKHRKGDANLKITDQSGRSLNNVKVKISQKSHEFRFGANIFMLDQLESEQKNADYKKYFSDVFNMATLPFYWDSVEPEKGKQRYDKDSEKIYRRPTIDACIEFCEEHNIEPREHALAYEHFFPKWLADSSITEIKSEMERRYSEIAERYADKIRTIEVTNEMAWKIGATEFYNDPEYIKFCFDLAKKYFPNNQLVINEYTELAWTCNCRTTDQYYSYIEANLLKGAKIDAIGMQYHIFRRKEDEYEASKELYNPKNLYRHMDLYCGLKKPLQVTEVTVPAYSWNKEDEEIQAQIIEKLYSIWFSHPSVEQIVYWNLVDGYAYVDSSDPEIIKASQGNMELGENYYYGGLLRFDLTPKPAYYKIKELIEKVWHTEVETLTDDKGITKFRGFYGDYDITVFVGDKVITKEVTLSSKGSLNIEIEI